MTGKAEWYQYSDRWCRHNEWKGAKSNDRRKWKYQWYGEGDDFVLFGDWQICFQTYIDMYKLVPAEYKVARAKEVMGYECALRDNKFWWWADALYMVMPVMTKMYRLTGETQYLDKLYENFLWSDSLMWDSESQLYYRDGKYIWPKVKTACDGGKSFWARGDGWVLAGLAKVLADMPREYKNRDIFVKRFHQLAEGVVVGQTFVVRGVVERDLPRQTAVFVAHKHLAAPWAVRQCEAGVGLGVEGLHAAVLAPCPL